MNELVVSGQALPAPVAEDDLKPELRSAMIIGGLFFVGFLGFAALVPMDAGAHASGLVAVSGNRQAVQHRDGGTVTALKVAEGDRVEKGQPLLEISASDIAAMERGLTREYLMLVAERSRLQAERAGLSTIVEPPEFAGLSAEDGVIAAEALASQRALLQARRASVSQQKRVYAQQGLQAGERISGFSAQRLSNAEQQRLIREELAGMRELEKKGFASTNRIRALERASASLEGEVGSLTARMSEAAEARQQASMHAILIDRRNIEEVDMRQREVATRLNEVQPQLSAARAKLARATLRAPSEGRVVGLTVFTVGGVVNPGQLLMEVVPDNRELVIQARLSPQDGDDVRPGMPVEVTFPSMRDIGMPVVKGTLKTVSADLLKDERTGEHYFTAEVRVPPDELQQIAEQREGSAGIGPGIPVEVMVKIADRTALSYLMDPVLRSLWRTGREH